MIDWDAYFASMAGMPVHPLLRAAEPFLTGGQALDLGCGAGQAAQYLAVHGYEVTALDLDSRAVELTRDRCKGLSVDVVQTDIRTYRLLPVDLIHCGFVLFFLRQVEVDSLIEDFRGVLRPGGLFIGQFLGVRDDWVVGDAPMLCHTPEEIDRLLGDWEVLHREEAERDGATAWGQPKHWHVTHVIARQNPTL